MSVDLQLIATASAGRTRSSCSELKEGNESCIHSFLQQHQTDAEVERSVAHEAAYGSSSHSLGPRTGHIHGKISAGCFRWRQELLQDQHRLQQLHDDIVCTSVG